MLNENKINSISGVDTALRVELFQLNEFCVEKLSNEHDSYFQCNYVFNQLGLLIFIVNITQICEIKAVKDNYNDSSVIVAKDLVD